MNKIHSVIVEHSQTSGNKTGVVFLRKDDFKEYYPTQSSLKQLSRILKDEYIIHAVFNTGCLWVHYAIRKITEDEK